MVRQLSLGYHTLGRTPDGGGFHLQGNQIGVRRCVIVHLDDYLDAPGRPGHVGGEVWHDRP